VLILRTIATCAEVSTGMFEESITRITELTARLRAKSASLSATIERWEIVMTAKIAGTPLDDMAMRFALESESILPRWKRKPHSFHQLANGEVVVFGGKPEYDAHSMRTLYVRPNYTQRDVDYLERVVASSYVITAEHADVILRQQKPNTAHSKRKPMEADPDPDMGMEYRARPERHLTAEEIAREQFTGRALERELARIGRAL
jgi:hypothetical protein